MSLKTIYHNLSVFSQLFKEMSSLYLYFLFFKPDTYLLRQTIDVQDGTQLVHIQTVHRQTGKKTDM